MSMNGRFRQVTTAWLARAKADPSLAESVGMSLSFGLGAAPVPEEMGAMIVEGVLPRFVLRMLGWVRLRGWLSRKVGQTLFSRVQPATVPVPAGPPEADDPDLGPLCDVHKDWHAIHWLLNGHPEDVGPPPGNAVLGGAELGEDLGYGPMRYLEPAEVSQVAEGLAKIPVDELMRRVNPKKMAADDVYGADWGDFDATLSLPMTYGQLVRFYQDAAQRGNAVLLWID
jgi:hypothetical protein